MSESENWCCPNCFSDYAIRSFIENSEEEGECDFCGARNAKVMLVSTVAEFVDEGIARKYENAAESVPYETAEGGYQWPVSDIQEILCHEEMIFDDACFKCDRDLVTAITRESRYYTVPLVEQCLIGGEQYMSSWENFCRIIKHDSRFTAFMRFSEITRNRLLDDPLLDDVDFDEFSLAMFWQDMDDLAHELLIEIPLGRTICRARMAEEKEEKRRATERKPPTDRKDALAMLHGHETEGFGHEDLTSPPVERTKNSRMSPAGISYFYGGEDAATCIAEIRPHLGARVYVAEFETVATLTVLDLAELPPPVSPFDGERYSLRFEEEQKPFLREFANEISKPIGPKDEPLEYIPTQVFSEFIKNNIGRNPIHGIRYKSALKKDGVSVVLFRGPDVSLSPERWLRFKGASRVRIHSIAYEYSQSDGGEEQ